MAALMLVEAVIPAGTLVVLREALSAVLEGEAPLAVPWAVALVALTGLGTGIKLLRTALSKGVAWRMTTSLRTELHARWLQRSGTGVGDRIAGLTDEVDQVQYAVSALVTAARNPVTLLGLLAAAVWVSPWLTVMTAALLAPVVAVAAMSARWVGTQATAARDARASLTALAVEQLHGREIIEAFGAAQGEVERFGRRAEKDRDARWRLDVARAVPSAATQLVAVAALAVLLMGGAGAVAQGALSAADLVTFAVGLALAQRPLSGLADAVGLYKRSAAALERVEAELAVPQSAWGNLASVDGAIELRGASLTGAVGPIDLRVPAGQFVALVGATGAGKTTVLRWIAGLSVPDDGAVRVGGVDVGRTAPSERPAAFVPQDGFLFARSVAENLALGRPDVGEDALVGALAVAQATHVAPLDRMLEPGGAPLSGGERQRLAVARALVMERPVLALDEPTAHVDPATEAAIIAALSAWRDGHTIVVATHDAQLAMAADRVVVLHEGRVIEDGEPSALRHGSGPFARWSAA